MRGHIAFCSLALIACVEAPRMQPLPPDPGTTDPNPNAADLSGVVTTNVDLAPTTLSITAITPKVASTLGREQITITGTGFDARTQVSFGGAQAEIKSVTETQIVALSPASPGTWGVPVTISVRRGSDGATAANSTGNDTPTSFRFYPATLDFRVLNRYNINQYPRSRAFQLMDTNKDGKPDLVQPFNGNVQMPIYLNNGIGDLVYTHNPATIFGNNADGNAFTMKTVAADLNGDGAMDLLSTADNSRNYWGYQLADLGLNGNLSPSINSTANYYNVCSQNFGIAAGLANNDDKLDVAIACYGNSQVRIWHNQGNNSSMFGGTNAGNQITLSTPNTNPTHVVYVDLDKDGKQDIVSTQVNSGQPTLYVWKNNNYNFSDNDRSQVGTNNRNEGPYWVTCRDINNDTYPDCVVTDQNTASVRVFLNNGTGTLQAPASFITVGRTPWEVAIEDVNLDGIQDLLVASYTDHTVTFLPGKGDGTFPNTVTDAAGRAVAARTNIPLTCRYGRNVQLADLDGDGIKEMAASCEYSEYEEQSRGAVVIFKNVSR